MKKALIVIDMQNDYFKGGAMSLVGIDEALQKANQLIKHAKESNDKIFIIEHIATKNEATFFLLNTDGVKLHKDLDTTRTTIIQKHFPNSFRGTSLQEELKKENISELVICGAMTHMCVDTTVRAAFDLGYNITLISDACATKNLEFGDKVINAQDVYESFMASLDGVFCKIVNTKEFCHE